MKVRLTPRAKREIRRIDDWWRSQRDKAPSLFRQQVDAALRLLAMVPTIGAPYSTLQGKFIRRFHLEKTKHHLYYYCDGDEIILLTIWGAARREPRL